MKEAAYQEPFFIKINFKAILPLNGHVDSAEFKKLDEDFIYKIDILTKRFLFRKIF